MAVGFSFVGALFLAALIFLATERGSETDALWVFPMWVALFVLLIWRVASRPQGLARGLALLGAEFLALPPAWLLYQGLPDLTGSDPRLGQTLSVMGLGLIGAAVLLGASFLTFRRLRTPASPGRLVLMALAALVFAVELVYAVALGVSLLRG